MTASASAYTDQIRSWIVDAEAKVSRLKAMLAQHERLERDKAIQSVEKAKTLATKRDKKRGIITAPDGRRFTRDGSQLHNHGEIKSAPPPTLELTAEQMKYYRKMPWSPSTI